MIERKKQKQKKQQITVHRIYKCMYNLPYWYAEKKKEEKQSNIMYMPWRGFEPSTIWYQIHNDLRFTNWASGILVQNR